MGFFRDSIIINSQRMLANIDQKVEQIATELFTEVVANSPHTPNAATAKGEFINNWNAAKNGELRTHTSARSMVGQDSLNSIASVRNSRTFLGTDGYMTLTNTTHYGNNVEYIGWLPPKWEGVVGPYAPVRKAFIIVAPKYK